MLTAWIARWLAPAIHHELDKMPVAGKVVIDFPRERTVTLPDPPPPPKPARPANPSYSE